MRSASAATRTRRLLRAGALAGPLFVTVFGVDGATRPDYRPRRHPVSSLALGPRGRLQTANFVVAGTLYLGGASALRGSGDPALDTGVGTGLVTAAAAGILGAGAFTTDPVSGYPVGTPDAPTERTTAGIAHDTVAVATFLGLPAAQALYSWRFARARQPGWALYSASSAATMLASLGISGAGFGQSPRFVDTAGRWQRVCITAGMGWLTALHLRALRGPRAAG